MNDKTGSSGDGGSLSGLGIGEAVKGISEKLGGVARDAADDIGKESPVVAGYVRDAAASIDKVVGGLRDHSVGDLLAMVTKFGRQQPVAFFAGAVVAGFTLSRLVKVGVSEVTPSPNDFGE